MIKDLQNHKEKFESKDRIYVMCRRGNASKEATEVMIKMGLTNAINVEGGIDAIRAELDKNLPEY